MKTLRRILLVLKGTGAIKLIFSSVVLSFIMSILLVIFEPNIKTFGDAFWYCYVASTTIGFGDLYASTLFGRVITVFVSLNGILVTAAVTGVVVSYYMEYLKDRQDDSISIFLEKLENLENLPKEELRRISSKVKKIK